MINSLSFISFGCRRLHINQPLRGGGTAIKGVGELIGCWIERLLKEISFNTSLHINIIAIEQLSIFKKSFILVYKKTDNGNI